MNWKEFKIPENEITDKVTDVSIENSKKFGKYLAEKNPEIKELTTSQLRKFFGEVKRQQLSGFDETEFAMLKPKLAYAAGRAHQKNGQYKIDDFYRVLSDAIDKVLNSNDRNKSFNNFIKIFEAIVAYHKAAENKIDLNIQ